MLMKEASCPSFIRIIGNDKLVWKRGKVVVPNSCSGYGLEYQNILFNNLIFLYVVSRVAQNRRVNGRLIFNRNERRLRRDSRSRLSPVIFGFHRYFAGVVSFYLKSSISRLNRSLFLVNQTYSDCIRR